VSLLQRHAVAIAQIDQSVGAEPLRVERARQPHRAQLGHARCVVAAPAERAAHEGPVETGVVSAQHGAVEAAHDVTGDGGEPRSPSQVGGSEAVDLPSAAAHPTEGWIDERAPAVEDGAVAQRGDHGDLHDAMARRLEAGGLDVDHREALIAERWCGRRRGVGAEIGRAGRRCHALTLRRGCANDGGSS